MTLARWGRRVVHLAVGAGVIVLPVLSAQAQYPADAQPAPYADLSVAAVPVDPPAAEGKNGDAASTAPAPPKLGEIVVTAQRREESLNTIPLAVSAFSGEDLAQLGISDTRDLGRIVPGFHTSDSGYSVPVYSLRGVGFNDISYSGTGTVGIYTDESPYAYAVMTKSASIDLQRVEVVKGPVGTLYGRNATGGAVNYIANKPTETFEAGLQGDVGRFETVDFSGFVSGPLDDDLRGRVALSGTGAGKGWQFSNTRPDDRLGKQERMAGRGTLDWSADDDLLFRFTASGWIDKSHSQAPYALQLRPQNTITGSIRIANLVNTVFGAAGLPSNVASFFTTLLGPTGETAFPGLVDPAVQNYPYTPDNHNPRRADWSPEKDWRLNDSFWNAGARSEWSLDDDTQLIALASFARFEADHSLVPQSGLDTLSADQLNNAKLDAFSEEIRLTGAWGDDIDWLAGISGAQDHTTEDHTVFAQTNSFNFGPPITGNPTGIPLLLDKGTFNSVNRARSYGAFASVDWAYTDQWKFTQGVRYTRERRTNVGCSFLPEDYKALVGLTTVLSALSISKGGPGGIGKEDCFTMDENGNPGPYRDKLKEHNFATRSVVSWTPEQDLMLFASYTRGYKSGGFPQIFATDQSTLHAATQERLIDYELGAKMTTAGRRLHLEAGTFYYDYKDKQLLTYKKDPLFGPLPLFRNIPKSRVIGGELSAQWVPVDGLKLSAAAAYVDTKIQKFTGFTANGIETDFKGRPFNYAPQFTATTIADYTIPITGRLDLGMGVDVSFSEHTNATLEGDPYFAIDHYWLLGAQIRLASRGGPWTVSAFGRNLTNEFYETGVYRAGDVIAASTGKCRMWGVGFTWNFE
jgi:outer membrane receptor protein involved in Fe transport